mmetsp:Transcript_4536/g.9990  ORF Transcript_4536/g.9990 Transcript_4536/m.9990 type:complete len:86 (+) Transcript_4536:532-789(+)
MSSSSSIALRDLVITCTSHCPMTASSGSKNSMADLDRIGHLTSTSVLASDGTAHIMVLLFVSVFDDMATQWCVTAVNEFQESTER